MSNKKYSKDHEWISINNDVGTIGITNHAQESLGDIVFIELPQLNKIVKKGEEVSVIESVKAASDIYSPVDGEIIEINQNLSDNAGLINEDAENNGWIFKIKISNLSDVDNLMTNEDYKQYLKEA